MQVIIASLQTHPLAPIESGRAYEVWPPINAPQAAQALLDLLAADSTPSQV
jgi:hypothetical protein